MNKGFYFSFDAIIAFTVIAASLAIVSQSSMLASDSFDVSTISYQKANLEGEDAMKLASRQDFNSFNGSFQQELVDNTVMAQEDLDRNIVDGVTLLWAARNFSYASAVSKKYFEKRIPEQYGYRLQVNNNGDRKVIYNTSDIPNDAEAVTSINRLVSGHQIDSPSEGFQSRAQLSTLDMNRTRTVFYGGYVGDGDISTNVTIDSLDEVQNITLEGDFSGPFNFYINGYDAGSYSPSTGNLSADVFNICDLNTDPDRCGKVVEGDNRFQIEFTSRNRSIGGGFLRIDFNRSEEMLASLEDYKIKRKKIHGIDGLINYYGSFYIPGDIQGVRANLHFDADNNTLVVRAGNATLYGERTIGEQNVRLDNQSIHSNLSSAGLSYQDISERTVPLRIGLSEVGKVRRAVADSVSVIDRSGSMCSSGTTCPDGALGEAKDAAKVFSHVILNSSSNRAGVVSYNDQVRLSEGLTTNETLLNNSIDTIEADGGTCIGCGILKATDMVVEKKYETEVSRRSDISYNNSFLKSYPPDYEGNNWTELDYNQTGWSQGTAIIGNSSEANTEIRSNGSVYFRKNFSIIKRFYRNMTLSIRSDDAVELYLNGRLLHNETRREEGEYWNLITGERSKMLEDSFERSSLGTKWNVNSGTEGDEVVIDDLCGSYQGGEAVVMDGGGGQLETDSDLDDDSKDLVVEYALKQGGGSTCEKPDSGEDLVLEYLDSTGSWNELNRHYGAGTDPSYGDWMKYSFQVSESEYHDGFKLRWRHTGGSSGYDHWAVDGIKIYNSTSEKVKNVDWSLVNDGENVVAARLKNEPGDHQTEFDLEVNLTEERNRSMIVMSDGEANVNTDMDDVPDHDGDGSVDAGDHTIEAACRAYENHSINVFTVGFGSGVDEDTLQRTADCGGGEYYFSSTGELVEIFGNISNKILRGSYAGQTLRVEDEKLAQGRLYDDSSIIFNYTNDRNIEYGEFKIKQISERFGGDIKSPKNGTFRVSEGTEPVSARVTSYSGNRWTDRAYINKTGGFSQFYNLSRWDTNYRGLGDPYSINVPSGMINEGVNELSLNTAYSPYDPEGASPDSRVIYNIMLDGTVGFGNVFENETDARKDAKNRLKNKLDVDDDGNPEVSLAEDYFELSTISLSGQPYLWGPASVKLVVWDE